MKNIKINIYKNYFEATGKDFNLLAFSMTDLINQLFTIYRVDLRQHLFLFNNNSN